MSEQSQFFTREKAEEGVKLPLFSPSGKPTKHYLIVRGIDSDEFRMAEAKELRYIAKIPETERDSKDEEAFIKMIDDSKLRTIASLVAGWSFEEECTQEAVVKFLTEARQLVEKINLFAGNRALFFAERSSD